MKNGTDEEVKVTDKRRHTDEAMNGNALPAKKLHTIEPYGEWVLIRKVFREEQRSEAGVVLVAGGRSSRGEVLAVGDGPRASKIEVGSIVIFTNFPIALEDLEELSGDASLKLVRAEEVYARARPCS